MGACVALGATEGAQPRPTLRVLFVGNSHTYTHDIPSLVSAIAASATGARPLVVATSVTIPGACLADHRRDGRAEQALRTGRFDVVVLQECGGGVARNRPRYWRGARAFQADRHVGRTHRARDGPQLPHRRQRLDRRDRAERAPATRETPEGVIAPEVAAAVWRAAWQSVRSERGGCLPSGAPRSPGATPDH